MQLKEYRPCNCKKDKKLKKIGTKQPAKEIYLIDHVQEIAIGVPVSIVTALLMRKIFLVLGFVQ